MHNYLISGQRMDENTSIGTSSIRSPTSSDSKSTDLKSPLLRAKYEYTDAKDSAGHQISYDPIRERARIGVILI